MKNKRLVQTLQERGFPLRAASLADRNNNVPIFAHGLDSIGRKGNWLYPSLSELIEACGDDFDSLQRIKDNHWQAYMTERAFDKTGIPCVRECDGYESADTPEEAVGRLWLLIHHK